MGQKKLIRFEAIKSFPNVLQYPEGMAGKWAEFYKNENPLTLELACGKGEYTVGLAQMYPDRNFLGVDLKGNRIYILAQSYMPAQDIHIVINPEDAAISPWYRAEAPGIYIQTPEWTFRINELRRWPTSDGKQ